MLRLCLVETEPDTRKEADAHGRATVDETQIPPIHLIPVIHAIVDANAERKTTVHVPKIRDQEHQQEAAPDGQVPRRAEDQCLAEGKRQVEVAQLAQCDESSNWETKNPRSGTSIGQFQVGLRHEPSIDCSRKSCDGLDPEEEGLVRGRNGSHGWMAGWLAGWLVGSSVGCWG